MIFATDTSPPVVRLPPKKNFRDQGFLPAALVYLGLEKDTTAISPFLKEELLSEIKEKLPPPALFGSLDTHSTQKSSTSADKSTQKASNTIDNTNTNINTADNTQISSSDQSPTENQNKNDKKKKLLKGEIPKWFLAGNRRYYCSLLSHSPPPHPLRISQTTPLIVPCFFLVSLSNLGQKKK